MYCPALSALGSDLGDLIKNTSYSVEVNLFVGMCLANTCHKILTLENYKTQRNLGASRKIRAKIPFGENLTDKIKLGKYRKCLA